MNTNWFDVEELVEVLVDILDEIEEIELVGLPAARRHAHATGDGYHEQNTWHVNTHLSLLHALFLSRK